MGGAGKGTRVAWGGAAGGRGWRRAGEAAARAERGTSGNSSHQSLGSPFCGSRSVHTALRAGHRGG